ncbi:MAG: cytochrome c [Hyphomicrobiales bacterium]|nr:cytochrome c [Hyphomicrobiales bacterium]
MRIITSALVLLAFAVPALADEATIKLKEAPGVEAVRNNCAACHSLDYPITNGGFLDAKGWTATVTKMQKTFGAPISDADAKEIINYLAANYGK